ncbi:cyclodeaminase [Neptunomonas antarctica]|uniref:Ornithine cyclodeaminase n=1 Tax=Neptunomonas antarctica TaxID=619304 RepID=A0A1N7N8Y2_9GAMM|nr:cyclodeaminase [Neptunomonas antarctica]SIS94805.1 ornithine cyclodeaminase [Neptunomonas antarctica]
MNIYDKNQISAVTCLDQDALAAVEDGFAALGRDEVTMPPILSMNIVESNGEVDVKTAHIRGKERFAIKISPGFFDNPKLGLPSLNGLMVLFSAKTGIVDSILFDEGYLTNIRTALAGAIAAKHLARKEATSVAVIGSGMQAELQVAALTLVRDIRQVHIFARSNDKMQTYKARMAKMYDLPVQIHNSAHSACSEADIVITTTPSTTPVLHWNDLKAGTHVTAMGSDNNHKQELESSILSNADLMIVDRRSQSETIGELNHYPGTFPNPIYELGSLIAEETQLRSNPSQITICDLTGTGVQDTAIANYTASLLDH